MRRLLLLFAADLYNRFLVLTLSFLSSFSFSCSLSPLTPLFPLLLLLQRPDPTHRVL
jgi:hypothetical protein